MENAESNPGRKNYHSQDLKRLIFKETKKKTVLKQLSFPPRTNLICASKISIKIQKIQELF